MMALVGSGCDSCNSHNGTSSTSTGGGKDMSVDYGDGGPPTVGELYITPPTTTLNITYGGPAASQDFVVKVRGKSSDMDVTTLSSFTLADATLGTMNAATFTTSGAHGGTTTLTATYNSMTATATINVLVTGSFTAPDCQNCPAFPPSPAPVCAAGTATPTLVYPPDGVLLPPNMENFSIHYLPAAGATEYEVDFENAGTDVRILHRKCNPQPMDSRGNPSGGCVLDLDAHDVGLHRQVEPRRRSGHDLGARHARRHLRDARRGHRQGLVCRGGRHRRHLLLEVDGKRQRHRRPDLAQRIRRRHARGADHRHRRHRRHLLRLPLPVARRQAHHRQRRRRRFG